MVCGTRVLLGVELGGGKPIVLAGESEVCEQGRPELLTSDAGRPIGRRERHRLRIADPSVAHDHDPVGERDGFVDLVGDEQHGCVMLAA
jgi:hypothetical protein